MSTTLSHPPARILLELLLAANVVGDPDEIPNWAVVVKHMGPDEDNIIGFYDTAPIVVGRILDGTHIRQYGVMARLRCGATEYPVGYGKIYAIDEHLTTKVKNTLVDFDNARYRVNSVYTESGPMYTGEEPETRRCIFTANFIATLREL